MFFVKTKYFSIYRILIEKAYFVNVRFSISMPELVKRFWQGHARDGTVPRFCPGLAGCPGLDCPVALSPGPVPNPGDLRDQHPDIVPGQPSIPGFEYNTLNFKVKIFL